MPSKGSHHTEDTRSRMSASASGRKHTPEAKAKISRANTGKVRTPEMRKRMAEAQSGQVRTPDVRRRISAALKGKPAHVRHPVLVVETGERFGSMTELAKAFGVGVSTVAKSVARGGKCQGKTIVSINE